VTLGDSLVSFFLRLLRLQHVDRTNVESILTVLVSPNVHKTFPVYLCASVLSFVFSPSCVYVVCLLYLLPLVPLVALCPPGSSLVQ
jgi:hypothetical protein